MVRRRSGLIPIQGATRKYWKLGEEHAEPSRAGAHVKWISQSGASTCAEIVKYSRWDGGVHCVEKEDTARGGSRGLVLKEPHNLIWNPGGLAPGFYNTRTMSRISSEAFWDTKPDMDRTRSTSLSNIPASPPSFAEYIDVESISTDSPQG